MPFWNPYKETLVSGLGVWNPYRKPMSEVWEGRMFQVVIFTFRNPYKETLVSGLGVWNPYRKPRCQVWEGRMLKGSDFDIPESL